MTEAVTITRHGTGQAGEYHAHVAGSDAIGRLTWVKSAVQSAKAEGFRIVPQCSYVAAAFARHPEWADLRA